MVARGCGMQISIAARRGYLPISPWCFLYGRHGRGALMNIRSLMNPESCRVEEFFLFSFAADGSHLRLLTLLEEMNCYTALWP